MIDDEVFEIVNGGAERADDLNTLVDQFRSGRDPEELLRLLFSENDDLVRIGVWITSEISADHYNTETFRLRLNQLTNHPIPSIRLYAFSSLFPFFDQNLDEAQSIITKLLGDSNEGVRETAAAAARTLGITP